MKSSIRLAITIIALVGMTASAIRAEEPSEGQSPAPAEKTPSKFKNMLGAFLGLRRAPAKTPQAEPEETDEEIVAPPVRAQAQTMLNTWAARKR